jgi:hypothetical protein
MELEFCMSYILDMHVVGHSLEQTGVAQMTAPVPSDFHSGIEFLRGHTQLSSLAEEKRI